MGVSSISDVLAMHGHIHMYCIGWSREKTKSKAAWDTLRATVRLCSDT
jgi:hypothetical protein